MHVQCVEISNVKGLPYLRFQAGALTVLEGANGEGKSSALDALRAIFNGGHDPSLVRIGEKKAEVTLTLSDGTTIRKTITEKRSSLDITTKDSPVPIEAPQTFVNALAVGFAFSPLDLITCDPKKRAEFILSAMPIQFEPAELAAAGVTGAQNPVDLDGLAGIKDALYESRKGLNKAVRDAEGTVTMLQRSLPEDDNTDWQKRWRELETDSVAVEREIAEEERAAGSAFSAACTEIAGERDKKVQDLEAQIREVKEKAACAIEDARTAKDTRLKRVAEVAKPERDRLATDKSAAWERSQLQSKAIGTRESIDAMRKKVRENFLESERLTKVMEQLDGLRKAKLDTLPIEGLEFRNGEVFVGGVSFDGLNTAAQVSVSIKLAKLKLGRLPLLVVDRAECLDDENWAAFCEAFKESDIQVIAARVGDGTLAVRKVG